MITRKGVGYSLLVASCLAWLALPFIPFMPLTTEIKVALGGGLLVFAEVAWWLSLPLLGKEIKILWQRLTHWFNSLYRQEKK